MTRVASHQNNVAVKNPATGIVGTVPALEAADIEQAVAAAEMAFRPWRALAAK
ncbi:aldehyde dehydrogenase family protein [Neorhizobium galegae]|uniref:aldehyde dehydrogenase family protein n=1 Tax=Neorhizobium galegae TaxID=399 RepID=UPI0020C7A218|nr:aldehyde dehydrogenase family protein [Neorhizobium galegae]